MRRVHVWVWMLLLGASGVIPELLCAQVRPSRTYEIWSGWAWSERSGISSPQGAQGPEVGARVDLTLAPGLSIYADLDGNWYSSQWGDPFGTWGGGTGARLQIPLWGVLRGWASGGVRIGRVAEASGLPSGWGRGGELALGVGLPFSAGFSLNPAVRLRQLTWEDSAEGSSSELRSATLELGVRFRR